MAATSFKRLILRAVLRDVYPMVIRLVAVPDSRNLPLVGLPRNRGSIDFLDAFEDSGFQFIEGVDSDMAQKASRHLAEQSLHRAIGLSGIQPAATISRDASALAVYDSHGPGRSVRPDSALR